MKEALVTSGVTAAFFLGFLLFEAGMKARILTANPFNEPIYRVAPSLPRYAAVLGIAVFLALQTRHYRLPYWSAVSFGIAFIVWVALLLWDVGKESARQRKLRESRDGAS
jgi:ABC-type Fe3+-siderophore transport system permease subunit